MSIRFPATIERCHRTENGTNSIELLVGLSVMLSLMGVLAARRSRRRAQETSA